MEYELDDIILGTIDYRGKTPKRFDSGIPVLSAANVKKGKIKIDDKFVSQEYYDKWTTRGYIKPGDILITTEAPVGEIAKVPDDQVYLISRRVFALQINEKIANETYLYYFLLTEGGLKYFESISHGATAPRIYKDEVLKLKINLPKLQTQKKIAAILSAYDDLIENNNQRINLLEGMAEEIYKEWFVRFRFPGYKEAVFVDKEGKQVAHGTKGAVPERWEHGTIGSLYKVSSGFAFKGSELGDVGVPIIKIRNINNLEIDLIKCDRFSGEVNKRVDKFLLRSKDLLIAMTGATIGKVSLFPNANEKHYLNQRVGKFFAHNDSLGISYIYQYVKTRYFKETINNYGMGAAQPNISGEQIESIKIIIPENKIINKFSLLADSMIDEMLILRSKNQILQETRDLLLPRLISGKLNVEGLER